MVLIKMVEGSEYTLGCKKISFLGPPNTYQHIRDDCILVIGTLLLKLTQFLSNVPGIIINAQVSHETVWALIRVMGGCYSESSTSIIYKCGFLFCTLKYSVNFHKLLFFPLHGNISVISLIMFLIMENIPGVSWLPTFAFHSPIMNRTFFWVLLLEGLVCHHRATQGQLLTHYWLGHRLGLQ